MENPPTAPWPDRRRKRRLLFAGLGAGALLLLAWFAWPTPWDYRDHRGREDAKRVHRLTGETQVRDPKGEWRAVGRGQGNREGTRSASGGNGSGGGSPIGGGPSRSGGSGSSPGSGEEGGWWYRDDGTERGREPAGDGSPIGGGPRRSNRDAADPDRSPIGGD